MAKEKVLLDSDMVELFDDGLAMIMLANSDRVDLLGVVTVTGNTWSREGTAYAIRQLEIIGKRHIPVAEGVRFPLRAGRQQGMLLERQLFGMGSTDFIGSFASSEPTSWQEVYEKRYQRKPQMQTVKQHGVDFIIDTIRANPGEVTIAAIGPCTNIAMAIRKDPDIIPLIKRIIYMGGAFDVVGNVTAAAEFNWWFDPEAARICVRAPFKEQIIVGLDVTDKVPLTKATYEKIKNLPGLEPQLKALFPRNWYEEKFSQPNASSSVWDLLVAAIIIDPGLVKASSTRWIDVNAEYTPDYGRALSYPLKGPKGTQKGTIIQAIDNGKFWQLTGKLIQRQ